VLLLPSQRLPQTLQLGQGGVADIEVVAPAEELLEVLDVRLAAHLTHEDLADVPVPREGLQPLGVADALGGLLPDEEVAAAPDDGEQVLVVRVVRGQRLDAEDELVVRQCQPARVARKGTPDDRLAELGGVDGDRPTRSTRRGARTPRPPRRGSSARRGRSRRS
jgi:hypothetical protein